MATIGSQLDVVIRKAGEASRSLSRLTGVRVGGSQTAARGPSTGDLRRMRGDLQGLGRKIDKIGAGKADPFLMDLFKSGPRVA